MYNVAELKKLSNAQLNSLSKKVNALLVRRTSNGAYKANPALKKLMGGNGTRGWPKGRPSPLKGSHVAPKWRHKTEKDLTWSGRGIKPKWVPRNAVRIAPRQAVRV